MRKQSHRRWLTVLALSIFLIVCSMRVVDADPPIKFGGWVTYWDFKRGIKAVAREDGIYQDIFLFSTQLNSEGTPIVVNSEAIDYLPAINHLKTSGIQTWMTFVNDVKSIGGNKSILKDSKIVHSILEDNALRLKHRRKIIDLALKYGVSGIDIDYENLLPEDRVHFSRFISELSSELKKRNLSLSVTVQPKKRNRAISGKSAMDWHEICRHADRLQIMLYNQHNKNTRPGPVATVNWISDVLQYAKSQCKLETIVPILKVSGMQWGPHKVTAVQYDQVVALQNRYKALLKREKSSQVPFFSYKINAETGVVYFEDVHSLKIKIKRIFSMGFSEVVFWSLGRQDPLLASELNDFYEPRED